MKPAFCQYCGDPLDGCNCPHPTAQPDITFAELLDNWWPIVRHGLAITTQRKRENIIRAHIRPSLGDLLLRGLTTQHLRKYADYHIDRGLASATIKDHFLIIQPALKWAVSSGLLPRNPADGLMLPRVVHKEGQTFTADEMAALIDSARPVWFANLVELAYRTGMRRGELYGLMWSDIDLAAAALVVRRSVGALCYGDRLILPTKTASSVRRILLDSRTVALLSEMRLKATGEGWVIVNNWGKPPSPSKNTRYLQDACAAAGIPKRPFHSLRHTHATLLLSSGINPKVVQERLGHSDVATTLHTYNHVLPTMQEAAISVLNSL